jgi:hypothetical protein
MRYLPAHELPEPPEALLRRSDGRSMEFFVADNSKECRSFAIAVCDGKNNEIKRSVICGFKWLVEYDFRRPHQTLGYVPPN